MVNTRNQSSRVDGAEANANRSANRNENEGPTVAELAELLKNVSAELEKTKAELQNVINQRDAFANALENSADEYSDRRNRGPSPTCSVTRASPSVHSQRRREEERPVDPNKDKEPVANRNGDKEPVVNPNNGGRYRAKEFKYESFTKCGTKEFDGTLDAVGSMEWLDDIEVVFDSCDCPEDKKVLCATRMLKKSARDWWKGTIVSMTPGVLSAMPWGTFKEKFLEEYCGTREKRLMEKEFLTLKKGDKGMAEYARSFMEKLKFVGHLVPNEEAKIAAYVDGLPANYRGLCRQHTTLANAIKESKRIEDDFKVDRAAGRNDDKKSGFKRKNEEDADISKKFKSSSSSEGKEDRKTSQWCTACKAHHSGSCSERTRRCDKCGKQGHVAPNCKGETRCYKCGETGHLIANCPEMKNGTKKDSIPKAKARVYQMINVEDERDDEVPNQVFL